MRTVNSISFKQLVQGINAYISFLRSIQELDWFCSWVRQIWLLRGVPFARIFSKTWYKNSLRWLLEKDTIPLYARRQFVIYRLNTLTHVYMKLREPDNFVLVLYHSGIILWINLWIILRTLVIEYIEFYIVIKSRRVEASLVRKVYVVFLADFPNLTFNYWIILIATASNYTEIQ